MQERMRQVGREKSSMFSHKEVWELLCCTDLPHLRILKLLGSGLKGHCTFEVIYHKK